MDDRVTVPIDVPLLGDERRKNWAKVVDNVDESKDGGWAYEGGFIATGGVQDVPVDSVLLVYGERGSRGNPQVEARVYTVNADATLSYHGTATGRAWARTLRDTVVELLQRDEPLNRAERPWDPALMSYSDEALEEELKRRSRPGT